MTKALRLILIISLCFSFALTFPKSCNVDNVKHGHCIGEAYAECDKKYATKESESNTWCNYKRRKQLNYFLIEAIAAFGAGHFYAKNFQFAFPKLIVWILAWGTFIGVRVLSIRRGLKDQYNLVMSAFSLIFLIAMLVWYIVDVIMIAENRYTDGEGVDLYPW